MKHLIAGIFCLLSIRVGAQVDMEVSVQEYGTTGPIANITILLHSTDIGYHSEKVTSIQGKVIFQGVPLSGEYTVEFLGNDNYGPARRSGILVRANTSASIQMVLFPNKGVPIEEIVIRGATRINARNAEVSSELRQKEIETLPLEGRDVTRLLYRLPNVVQATGFYPEAPNVSINGSNGLFTNYMIDGMDNNERFLGGMKFNIPVGFAKNINVLTNNFSTEYGLTANGVVNITSRSGSNDFHGEAFAVTRPGAALDAASPYTQRDLSGNQVKDGFQRYQAGVGFGGALRKDRTFYYVNAEYTRDIKDNLLNSPALGVNETVRGENNFTYLSAKIDHRWSARFRSALRTNVGTVNIGRQAGGLSGGIAFPSAANFQDRNSVLIASQNTYIGERFKSETNLQYGRFRWNYGRAVDANAPQVLVLDKDEQPAAVLGHPGYIFDETENTLQGQQKFSWYTRRHTFKTGVEIISADHQLLGGGNVNGNYTVKLTDAQQNALRTRGADLNYSDLPADVQVLSYNVELRPAAFGARQNIFSAYAEDVFSLNSRLNLTAGLRYDVDNLSKGGSNRADLNNIAPRLSFNYKINAMSSLRGGYGIFYDKISYAVYSDALQQNTTAPDYKRQLQALIDKGILPRETDLNKITFDGNLSAFASNVAYLAGPSFAQLQGERANAFSNERRILNPNGYQNPYSHQFSLGYQHQLDEKRLFYIDVVYNRSEQLFRLRDLNAPAPYPLNDPAQVKVRTGAEADLTRPVPIQAGGFAVIDGQNRTGVARNIVVSETAGSARYIGASFNMQKDRSDDNYAWRLIYTISRLRNNTEDINFRAQDSNRFDAEWGPGINDRTHVINAIYQYFPLKNLSFVLATLIQSGQPVNRIPDAQRYGTTDLNGDGRSFGDAYVGNSDRYPGESRNSDRLPWNNLFDIAAEYRFPRTGLLLRADVFNLFNAQNMSGYSNNATQSNQVQVGAAASGLLVRRNAAPPRQFQFSLRFAF